MSGKRYWAVMIKQMLAALLVVFLIGVIIERSTSTSDSTNPIRAGAFLCAIYVGTSLLLVLVNSLSQALYVWLMAGDDMVDSIFEEMRALKLPPPSSDQFKDYDYLNQVVNDEDADTLDRVRAASFTGAYNALMAGSLFRALRLRKALDAAVLRYSQGAPKA